MDSDRLKIYKYMVESNPAELVGRFDEFYSSLDDAAEQKTLKLYKAMALVSLQDAHAASELAETLIGESIASDDKELLCRCYIVLSKCNSKLPVWQKHYLDLAHEAAKELDSKDLISEVLIFIADTYSLERDSKRAFKYYDMSWELAKDSLDHDLQETILINIATAHYRTEQYDKAIEFLCKVLEHNEKSQNQDRRLLTMCNLSVLYQNLNRYIDAETILIQALKLSEDTGNALRRIVILSKLGSVYLTLRDFERSQSHFLECLSFSSEVGFENPEFRFELYNNLAGLYRLMNQNEDAIGYLDKALDCAEILDRDDYRITTMENRANVLSTIGKTEESVTLIKKVISICRKKKYYENLISSQSFLAELYEYHKEKDKAIATYKDILASYKEYIAKVHSTQIDEYNKKIAEFVKTYGEPEDIASTPESISLKDRKQLVGKSEAIKKVLEQTRLAASHPNPSVLITGESGTGKEIVAQLIHRQSSRSKYPLVAINTAAISASLVESELFGYVKGAFTGAYKDSKGIFQRAQHGTVFLDEIAEMPYELQAKLLRALETRKVMPVGGKTEIAFDCRIISSTNRDVDSMVEDKLFRLDLLHRLNTFVIHIPPLRDRKEDIAPLIDHYTALFAQDMRVRLPHIMPVFYEAMMHYAFPGNVRELINIIERLMIMHPGEQWGMKHLEQFNLILKPKKSLSNALKEKFVKEERKEIIEALQKAGGKQKTAAKLLGISESTLTRRIEKYSLKGYTIRGS